jgi:hypothetical protein
MARIVWTEEEISKREHAGRGRGQGETYKSWTTIREFNSTGKSSEIWWSKFNRYVTVHSELEEKFLYCLWWQTDILDIWEQKPLDREIALDVAREQGIKYPCYPRTKVPAVMTFDFLVTHSIDGVPTLVAYDVKHDDATEDKAQMKNIALHQNYCKRLGIKHVLVVGGSIPADEANNLLRVYQSPVKNAGDEPHPGFYLELRNRIIVELPHVAPQQALHRFCTEHDKRLGNRPGSAMRAVQQLINSREIKVYLGIKDIADTKIRDIVFP